MLSVRDQDSGRRALYSLPSPLPPGGYRLLVRAPDAAARFAGRLHRACPVPDVAASRWVPFRIP